APGALADRAAADELLERSVPLRERGVVRRTAQAVADLPRRAMGALEHPAVDDDSRCDTRAEADEEPGVRVTQLAPARLGQRRRAGRDLRSAEVDAQYEALSSLRHDRKYTFQLMPVNPHPHTGSPALMRALNQRALLDLLRRDGPLSRAELARRTGLSKPTVSQ